MESTISLSTTTKTIALFSISKALNRHFFQTIPLSRPLLTRRLTYVSTKTPPFVSSSTSLTGNLCGVLPQRTRLRVECLSSSAASFGTGGGSGNVGGGDGGGGGGGGESEAGDSKSKLGGGGGEEVSAVSSDVIILDVGGMTCGGCAASVKKILESQYASYYEQPQVSSASVNLTTETAIVWPVSEAKVVPNWQKELGEVLAKHLTSCGFTSNLRDSGTYNFFRVFERKMNEKRSRLKESGWKLVRGKKRIAFAWRKYFREVFNGEYDCV